eukprot:GHVU01211168.1.p3 GENE.GHVU01211168.1~~GHVU01211168.1.p3  ORF type:complete len:144 (-),score=24.90 GHVU01211168.1:600-1031(-)
MCVSGPTRLSSPPSEESQAEPLEQQEGGEYLGTCSLLIMENHDDTTTHIYAHRQTHTTTTHMRTQTHTTTTHKRTQTHTTTTDSTHRHDHHICTHTDTTTTYAHSYDNHMYAGMQRPTRGVGTESDDRRTSTMKTRSRERQSD